MLKRKQENAGAESKQLKAGAAVDDKELKVGPLPKAPNECPDGGKALDEKRIASSSKIASIPSRGQEERTQKQVLDKKEP